MPGRKRDKINTPVYSPDDPNRDESLKDEQGSGLEDKGPMGKAHTNRSAQSVVEGGDNEVQGEPAEGYHTVAPGHQNGGKR